LPNALIGVGGPVGRNQMLVIHSDETVPSAIRINKGVYAGGDIQMIDENSKAIILNGYAG
jgi:putative AlgH/UPF0301 family transcriptional regulator